MEIIIDAQLDLFEQIKRANTNFKKTPKDRLNVSYINVKLELLGQTWDLMQENHMQLLRSYDKATLATTNYIKQDTFYLCQEEYTIAKVTMKEKLLMYETGPKKPETSSNRSTASSMEVKIPALKIPAFSGHYTEWNSFHDQFVSLIHSNKTLSDVQKLHYLKMHITGEAANLLKNIPVTDHNYEHAWNKLNKRFANNRIIVNAYIQKQMSIRTNNIESASSIRNILDTTTDCLSGLRGAGVDTSHWDAILVYMTSSKLDTETQKLWEDKINRDSEETLPTFKAMSEFLESRFKSLEVLQATRNATRSRPTIERKVYYTNNTDGNDIQPFEKTNKKEHCTYCNGNHYIFKCKQFCSLSYDDKRSFLEKKRLCFNCLIPNHGVKFCNHTTRCRTCGKKHHSLIHPPEKTDDDVHTYNTNKEASDTETDTKNDDEKIQTHFSMKQKTNTDILLATAIVKVKSHSGRILQLRALIDQGSEGSFITESAAQDLGLNKKQINVSISGIGDTKTLKTNHLVTFNLQSNLDTTFNLSVEAYVLKTLTHLLPSRQVNTTWKHFQGLQLADPHYGTPGKIDLLLGAAVYSRIVQNGVLTGPHGTPLAQKTQLGWILSGEVRSNDTDNIKRIVNMHITTTEDDKQLRMFWEMESEESCNPKRQMTEEELLCEKIYEDTHSRDTEGNPN